MTSGTRLQQADTQAKVTSLIRTSSANRWWGSKPWFASNLRTRMLLCHCSVRAAC
jgi:hypothetical protein